MYYPIILNLEARTSLVVGGGKVALRKARNILEAGGRVNLVSLDFIEEIYSLGDDYGSNLNIIKKAYDPEDLDGVFMVFIATCNRDLNREIAGACERRGILCNVADSLEESDFLCPSVLRREELLIAVSTLGAYPKLAREIRRELEANYGDFDSRRIEVLGKIRRKILEEDLEDKDEILSRLLNLSIEDLEELYENLFS